jgi:dihydrofolate reductase
LKRNQVEAEVMGKLIASEFITVDGVIEDPGGAEGFERGGWALRFDRGSDGDKFKLDEVMEAEALLLGRKTYEGFAQAWPSRSDPMGFAEKMNRMPKYVVTSSPEALEWNNSHRLSGDLVHEVAGLKARLKGDLLIAGSASITRAMVAAGMVDELRLMVFPVVVGSGQRLFEQQAGQLDLRLADSRVFGSGVALLVFEPAA